MEAAQERVHNAHSESVGTSNNSKKNIGEMAKVEDTAANMLVCGTLEPGRPSPCSSQQKSHLSQEGWSVAYIVRLLSRKLPDVPRLHFEVPQTMVPATCGERNMASWGMDPRTVSETRKQQGRYDNAEH